MLARPCTLALREKGRNELPINEEKRQRTGAVKARQFAMQRFHANAAFRKVAQRQGHATRAQVQTIEWKENEEREDTG